MELCGGELKEISSLELMKREDIEVDRAGEDDWSKLRHMLFK